MHVLLGLPGFLFVSAALLAAPASAQTSIWMLARSLQARAIAESGATARPPATETGLGAGVAASGGLPPGAQCRAAIAAAQRTYNLPPDLLTAIGLVESGRRDPSGRFDPWPWSINVEGTDHVYASKADAIAAVRDFQSRGARSIDVGCLQVNLMYHPSAFASLEAAFDPMGNADYAARFLQQLHDQTGSWQRATAWYHSASPELGGPYLQRVQAVLGGPELRGATLPPGMQPPALAAAPAPGPAAAGGASGPWMLNTAARSGRSLGGALPVAGLGRGLAAYRAAPVRIASGVAFH